MKKTPTRSKPKMKGQQEWLELDRFTFGDVTCSVRLERQRNGDLEPVASFWSVTRRVGFILPELEKDVFDSLYRARAYMKSMHGVLVREKKLVTLNPVQRLEPVLQRLGK